MCNIFLEKKKRVCLQGLSGLGGVVWRGVVVFIRGCSSVHGLGKVFIYLQMYVGYFTE